MQQSKERPAKSERGETGATTQVRPRAKHARPRKAPVTVPVPADTRSDAPADAPAEATADLNGSHLPPREAASPAESTQTATSLRTLAAMHPQLRSASGSHAKPAAPPRQQNAVEVPPPTAPAPRSTPIPVEETPDLALGRAWRPPIAPQALSSPLTSLRKGALSRPRLPSKAQRALAVLRAWMVEAPRAEVITWAAIAQAALALLGALIFAALALRSDPQTFSALLFAALAGVPAGLAYALASRRMIALLGVLALIGSQIALFAWSFALVGPRPALLLLVPALLVVAMEMGGKALGGALAAGLGAVYAWFALTSTQEGGSTASFDLLAVLVGLAAASVALLLLYQRITLAEALSKNWQTQAERSDTFSLAQRMQAEEESAYLSGVLAEALNGRGVIRVSLEGPLAKLSEMVYTVASRLMTLRRDRDERVRLEGALAELMRAVEDTSAGEQARWPRETGTPVDTLSDQLRAFPVGRSQARHDLRAPDTLAIAPNPQESNIRYLFPRSSGSHPRGM